VSVAIANYGAGNLRSILAALRRLDLDASVTQDPTVIADADQVILPGVGSAASAMATLRNTGMETALRRRHTEGKPILGICMGMQLAVDETEEDGGIACLGLVRGRCTRLRAQRVPRMGWACVEPWGEAFYFAHSYSVNSADAVATSEGVTAAIVAGAFTGVQFHPEKSGAAGSRFLQRCLSAG
jgi:glutamine amidotransferase